MAWNSPLDYQQSQATSQQSYECAEEGKFYDTQQLNPAPLLEQNYFPASAASSSFPAFKSESEVVSGNNNVGAMSLQQLILSPLEDAAECRRFLPPQNDTFPDTRFIQQRQLPQIQNGQLPAQFSADLYVPLPPPQPNFRLAREYQFPADLPSPSFCLPQLQPANVSIEVPKTSPEQRKLCCEEGCKSQARVLGRCKRHGGSKRCSSPGCDKSVQSRGLCIRHGGGSRCQENGCTRATQSYGKCKLHGGGRPCSVPGCKKKAHLKRLCRQHGGGVKCSIPGCEKWAQRQSMCMKHVKELLPPDEDMNRVKPSTLNRPQVQDIRHASVIKSPQLSDPQYTALWTFMAFLHVVCAVFLICCAKLYWIMENEYIDYFADLLSPARDRHFRVVGTALGVLGGTHVLQLLLHLRASVLARKLAVRPLKIPDITTFIAFNVSKLVEVVQRWKIIRNNRRRPQHLFSVHRDTMSSTEAYSHMFAFRKMVEIATQVPNAYLYSKLITRSWINHAKVALVVVNCWSAFVIHRRLLKRSPTSKQISPSPTPDRSVRFSAVLIDSLLAVATGIILPSAIVMPYMLQFDFETLDFPDALLYGDTAFPNLVLENRAFFAISWDNAVIRGVPHVSAFFCLITMASMLNGEYQTTTPANPPSRAQVNKKRSIIAAASFRALTQATDSVHRITRRIYSGLVPLLFLATGGFVLILHLVAQYDIAQDTNVMPRMCRQSMHPWLAPNSSCAVIKYNCYREGVATPPFEALTWLEREAVRKIIFMHCSAFVMPPIIREFPSLLDIELWNITLKEWGQEAAVSAELHPDILSIFFTYVNLTSIPAVILQNVLPERLTDLEFAYTNLTTLPDDIVHSWRGIKVLFIEHSRLDLFPKSILKLPFLSELLIIGNNFEEIPEDAFMADSSPFYYDLALSHNPLRALPEMNRNKLNINIFNLALEYTQVRELPAWIDTNVWVTLSLGGSPLCDPSSDVKIPRVARCGHDQKGWDPFGDERFPIQLVTPYRLLNS